MSVDLPEPDGPITVVSCASADVERDPAQGVDGRVALAVAAGDILLRRRRLRSRSSVRLSSLASAGRAEPTRRASRSRR